MIGPAEIFTIFFVTLGPLKLLGPFADRKPMRSVSEMRSFRLGGNYRSARDEDQGWRGLQSHLDSRPAIQML
jgi:hypothetical protein